MKIRKIFGALLLIALFVPILSSCSAYARRALKIGAYVSLDSGGGLYIFTAAVITEGDGSIHSCRIRGERYGCDELSGKSGGVGDTPIIDFSLDSDGGAGNPTVTVTEYNSSVNEAVAEFENSVRGKNLDYIRSLLGKNPNDLTEYELTPMGGMMLCAVEKALVTKHIVNFRSGDDLSVGLSYMPVVTSKRTEEGLPAINVSVNVGAVALGSDKVINCAVLDCVDADFGGICGEDGKSVSVDFSFRGTKLEQGDSYGMVAYGGAIAEWYVQAQTYANTAIGKTVDAVAEIPEFNVAGCTIYVAGYKPALVAAAQNAENK